MSNEDFYKPTNLRDSIFGSIDLPQQSGIHALAKKQNKYQQDNKKANKYESLDDKDDGVQFNDDLGFSMMGEVSNVQMKNKYEPPLSIIKEVSDVKKQSSTLTRANSQQKQTSSQKSQPPKITLGKKPAQQVRRAPTKSKDVKTNSKNTTKQKVVVDLDTEIGQVRQWAHRQENQKQSDFDKSDQQQEPYQMKTNKQVQDQLRRKAQEKAKMLQKKIQNKGYSSQPKGLGLKAKAEQLRKKNQELQGNSKKIQKAKSKINHVSEQHEESSDNLKANLVPQLNSKPNKQVSQTKKQIQPENINETQQQQQQQDDPWQKINQRTKQQYQKKQEKSSSPISKQQVIEFYTKKFIYVEEDIIHEFQIDDLQDEKVPGCWEALFGCFSDKSKDDQDKKTGSKKHKDRTALRLVAISKINLSNSQEEFFILKQIWTILTKKTFARYGNHWNEIGFQGRDPATDLRSTGVLSLLQWYLFIEDHLQNAREIYEWTTQNDFPLALTHIKATGLFLKLIKNGKIKTNSWNEYQKYYNCIIIQTFKLIKKNYDPSDNIGQTVDKNLQNVKKSLSERFKAYSNNKKN